MSSLYSLLRKGRIRRPVPADGMTEEEADRITGDLVAEAKERDCILVNAQSVAADLIDTGAYRKLLKPDHIWKIPCVTPPFASMWIEFMLESRWALQIVRETLETGHHIAAFTWVEEQGHCGGPILRADFWLDENGDIGQDTWQVRNYMKTVSDDDAVQRGLGQCWFNIGVGMQALSRMNCRNVELRPINEGKFRPHPPNKLIPMSVWHEIVITSVPKIRSGGRDVFPHDDNETRLHWIRGHYADYRNGPGLFGNPKLRGLYWIPEYERGNEELGRVIPEYTIQ